MSKRPLGHGDIRHMGNFKAIAMDFEYYLSLADEGRLYCLTDRQIYILIAQLDYVAWMTRWYNTDDINATTLGYIRSELELALLSCVDVSVLVSQAELNLVDSVTNKALESQALRDILEEEYDGTPTSINPNAPTTDFGSTGDRYDALCAGLTAFVYQFARNQADSVRAGQVGGLLSVALIAALLIPGLNFFFIVGASIAVLLGLGTIGVTTEVAITALTDRTALDLVICYMRDTLDTESVTEANWNACLDSYPFTVGSNAAIVADFIKACLPQNYLTILNILGEAYTGVINGDPLPDCPCDEGWEKVWDLSLGAGGWTINRGGYVPGTGIQSLGSGLNPYTADISRNVTWPGGSALTAIEIEATSTVGDAGAFRGVYYPGSGYANDTCCETMTGDYTMTFDPVSGPVPGTISVQVSNNTIPGTNTIRSVTFRGTGPEPTW